MPRFFDAESATDNAKAYFLYRFLERHSLTILELEFGLEPKLSLYEGDILSMIR